MKKKKDKVLENWMKEFFPYSEFRRAGVFTKEMKGDYEAQSQYICRRLNLASIYEYGKEEIRCHITYANPSCPAGISTDGRPLNINVVGKLKEEPFVTFIPSIWDEDKKCLIEIDGSKYDEGDEEPGDGDADSPVLNSPPKVYL
jgi:hypothetical protein